MIFFLKLVIFLLITLICSCCLKNPAENQQPAKNEVPQNHPKVDTDYTVVLLFLTQAFEAAKQKFNGFGFPLTPELTGLVKISIFYK